MTARPFEYLPGRWTDGTFVAWRHEAARPPPERLHALSTSAPDTPDRPAKNPPWDRRAALHFARRLGFGATPEILDALSAMTQAQAVDAVMDAALAAPGLPDPVWISEAPPNPQTSTNDEVVAYVMANRDRVDEVESGVYRRMTGGDDADPIQALGLALRERMALVWHDHFVTQLDVYAVAPWLHRYWACLRDGALGDFRLLVHRIGLEPAMLVFLNGADNRAGQPNENYARELLELFTMGILDASGAPTYTENDVQEMARVLTGWSVDLHGDLDAHLVPDWHDTGRKRVFGQRDRWTYDDVVPLLFGQRRDEIATFVCRKLYQAFVSHHAPANVVAVMAQALIAADWRIEGVLRVLFSNGHFISPDVMGVKIKSPLDQTLGLYCSVRRPYQDRRRKLIRQLSDLAGQTLFDPPDVSGWPGHRAWMDTSRLAVRWYGVEKILQAETDLRAVALALPDPSDPAVLAADLAELFLGLPVSADRVETFTEILLGGIPPSSWDPAANGAEARLAGLVGYLAALPEHELI